MKKFELPALIVLGIVFAWWRWPAPAAGGQPALDPADRPVAWADLAPGGAPPAILAELAPASPAAAQNGPVSLRSRVSHPLVLAGQDQAVTVHVELAGTAVESARRPDLNLALVIDRSGSMAAEGKLENAKQAALQTLARLREGDRIAVISYDTQVALAVPSTNDPRAPWVANAVEQLIPGGSTDLYSGLQAGIEEVRRTARPGESRVVLLLSDGKANHGITDPWQLGALADQARDEGIRVSTLGLGLDYDEDLLRGVADAAGGAYFYVPHSEAVGGFIDSELNTTVARVARDVELLLELGPGVELLDGFGYAVQAQGSNLRVRLRDLVGGGRNKLVLKLKVPAGHSPSTPLLVPRATYRDAKTEEPVRLEGTPLQCRRVQDPVLVERSRDLPVIAQGEIVEGAGVLMSSTDLAAAGQIDQALSELTERRERGLRLVASGLRDEELERLLDRMQEAATKLEASRHSREGIRDFELSGSLKALGYLE